MASVGRRLALAAAMAALYGAAMGIRYGIVAALVHAVGVPLAFVAIASFAAPAFYIALWHCGAEIDARCLAAATASGLQDAGRTLAGLAPATVAPHSRDTGCGRLREGGPGSLTSVATCSRPGNGIKPAGSRPAVCGLVAAGASNGRAAGPRRRHELRGGAGAPARPQAVPITNVVLLPRARLDRARQFVLVRWSVHIEWGADPSRGAQDPARHAARSVSVYRQGDRETSAKRGWRPRWRYCSRRARSALVLLACAPPLWLAIDRADCSTASRRGRLRPGRNPGPRFWLALGPAAGRYRADRRSRLVCGGCSFRRLV
jgi:hypothetical protein